VVTIFVRLLLARAALLARRIAKYLQIVMFLDLVSKACFTDIETQLGFKTLLMTL
jgi:hypothetical protein